VLRFGRVIRAYHYRADRADRACTEAGGEDHGADDAMIQGQSFAPAQTLWLLTDENLTFFIDLYLSIKDRQESHIVTRAVLVNGSCTRHTLADLAPLAVSMHWDAIGLLFSGRGYILQCTTHAKSQMQP